MNLLALDLSLVSTGYCHNGVTGVLGTPKRGVERLVVLSEAISDLIREFSIDVVVIEGYSFASRSGQAFSIGELGGAVRVVIHKLGIPYIEVPPTCRAKFATGKGNASKNEVVSAVSARTGIVWQNPGADDKCDAWILEEMARCYLGLSQIEWPKVNKEGLKAVDWSSLDVSRKDN